MTVLRLLVPEPRELLAAVLIYWGTRPIPDDWVGGLVATFFRFWFIVIALRLFRPVKDGVA
jgi:hypothetical protein